MKSFTTSLKREVVLASLAICACFIPSKSLACSFTWSEGFSPEEIRERKDLRKVIGTFEIINWDGQADENGELSTGKIYSRLSTKRGTGWYTWQEFSRISLDCGAYLKPLNNARGTFYISRRKIDGRYEILLWDGEYISTENSESGDQ